MRITFEELPFGFSWMHPKIVRTSHALLTDGRVWLVDPVDVPEAMSRATSLGEIAGVIQLIDRHDRDCAALASRFGVRHLRVPAEVPGSPFTVVPVLSLPGWREVALWWPEPRALVVSELIGTAVHYALGSGPAGIHPLLRALPPAALRGFAPEHLLVGHGGGVHGPAAASALTDAYDRTRRDLPKLALRVPKILRASTRR